MRRLIAALAALVPASALAQTQPNVLPPETAVVSPGGVDMVSGRYPDEATDLSIGSDANGGINFTRVNEKARPFRTNWHFYLKRECKRGPGPPTTPCTVVWSLESKALSKSYLEDPPGNFVEQGLQSPGYTRLEYVGVPTSAYRFTANDGTLYLFESGGQNTGNVWVASITRKDGVVYTLTYDNGGDSEDTTRRVRRVKSNTGYELILEYTGNGSDKVSKACVFNTTVTTPPVANTCPAGVQTVQYTYTGTTHRVASITDPLGKVWTITNSFTGSNGTQAFYKPGIASPWLTNTFAGVPGNLAPGVSQQQYADGRVITYAYEDFDPELGDTGGVIGGDTGRGISWTDNGTATTTLGWEANQQNGESPLFVSPAPVTITDPLNRTTAIDFDGGQFFPHGNPLSKTLPNGRKESYTYGTGGLTQRKWEKATGFTDPDLITAFTYDCTVNFNCAKPITQTDPRGNTTDYSYSSTHGLMLTETLPDPDGAGPLPRPQKRYTYAQFQARYKNTSGSFVNGTPVWLLTQIAECRTGAAPCAASDETLTVFTYPGAGTTNNLLPTSKTVKAADDTLIATTGWTYDTDGSKLTEDGPLSGTGDTSRWRYDAKRRVTATMAPDPDGAGGGKPVATVSTYDDAGRLTKVENGTVNSQATDWTSFAATDAEEFTYDALDRKTKAMKKSGATTFAVTQHSYDLFGRLECTAVRMNSAVWGSLPASACTLGTQGSEGPDRITKNTYDLAGQLMKVSEALGTADEADEATYAYTATGKREFLTDARNYKAQFVYDGHDRQTQWRFPDKVLTNTVSATDKEVYELDLNGNRTKLTKRDGAIINYSYDNLNRMTVKDLPGAFADFTYGYDNLGRQTTASRPGTTITNSYDALGRLTVEQQPFGRIESQYDPAGNRTRVTYTDTNFFTFDYDDASRLKAVKENGGTSLATLTYDTPGRLQTVTRANGTSTTYGYDPISRLASLNQDLASTPSDATFTFTYNKASQVLTRTLTNDALAFTGLTAGGKSYTTNGLNQYTAIAGASPLHDANGNLSNDGAGQSYSYDPENRLIAASGPRNATLGYDPMGRLAQVSDVATRRMAYDGDALAEEYDGAGNLLRRFVHGPGVDDPLVWYEGASFADRRFLHADHQGSIVAISDGTTNTTINKYDEYGVPQAGFTGRFGYTGQAWVPELELWYYKARFYSGPLGRFMQVDPVGYDDQINLYAYVGNDPTNRTDPSGLGGACDFSPTQCGSRDLTPEDEERITETATNVGLTAVSAFPLGRGIAWAGRLLGIGRASAPAVFKATLKQAGMSPAKLGEAIGWGGGRTSAAQATERTKMITSEVVSQMQSRGLTRELAVATRNFYRSAVAEGKGGTTAVERLKLMEKILKNWKKPE